MAPALLSVVEQQTMLQNYITIAFRALLKFRSYALVNLAGLSLGLAAGMMILLYITDELSFDRFHSRLDRIYRVETRIYGQDTAQPERTMETNGWPVGQLMKASFPEIEALVYTRSAESLYLLHDGKKITERSFFASADLFRIFTFPLVAGDAASALAQPNSLVISERLARKYFANGDALNRTLMLSDTIACVVTGVMKDIPANSHIQADMFISFSTYERIDRYFSYNEGWGNLNVRNYLLLAAGADAQALAEKSAGLYETHAPAMLKDWGATLKVGLRPVAELYLQATSNGMGPLGSMQRLWLLGAIAFFVIVLACINFINLTTARSVDRAREVGVRKVTGSTRAGLIRQFMAEALVITALAFAGGLAIAGLILPLFNELLQKNYTILSFLSAPVIAGCGALIVLVAFLSGYYPAMVMSALKPAEILKGKMRSSSRGIYLRRSLVVFQFVVSMMLVLGTLIVLDQLDHMQRQDLGFAKDELLVVNTRHATGLRPAQREIFRNALEQISQVEAVSLTNSLPGHAGWRGQIAYPEGRTGSDAVSVEYMAVDDHYLEAVGLNLVAGENFSQAFSARTSEGLILNERAVEAFGWSTPAEALGKHITSPSGFPQGKVLGVVKDYHQFGVQQEIGPMTMDYNTSAAYMFALRYKPANTASLLASAEKVWKEHFPEYEFNYFFLNEDFERQYQTEQRIAKIFALFAGLTITIALIGLTGLVSFIVASRTKEIGVRKVLGASAFSITRLVSGEFVSLVIVANLIAVPVIIYLSQEWLKQYATRTTLDPLLFFATVAGALVVTLAAIGVQTMRAALSNPVDSLRYE